MFFNLLALLSLLIDDLKYVHPLAFGRVDVEFVSIVVDESV